jgi:succinyl-diaminopimelate desuccinylase
MSETLRLTEQLIARPSVTPDDAGCQALIAQQLQHLGFVSETIISGPDDFRVTNLWAKLETGFTKSSAVSLDKRPSQAIKTIVFAGHTDVVPTGPLAQWSSPPFVPTHADGRLYGRGASDMKTSLAAMIVAVKEFLAIHPQPAFNVAFLLTSDEEGPARDGTVVVCNTLKARGERLDCCIVGEPTSVERTGDMIKNGRRGTMSGRLTVKGIQGHIAYPHLAKNPIHMLAPVLAELTGIVWDEGNDFFPPTTWQVSNIHGGTGASNVIPGDVVVDFNFRFSTESTPEGLQQRLENVLQIHRLQKGTDYELVWTVGGVPFLTRPGLLVNVVREAIRAEIGVETELSTTGGTSDGRFIAQICPEVIELGPPNRTIHKINECVAVADIEPLKNIYRKVLELLHHQESARFTCQ